MTVRQGTTAPTPDHAAGGPPATVDELCRRARSAHLGADPAALHVSTAFTTRQGVRHEGRSVGYRNDVLSLRVEEAVGSCAVESGQLDDEDVFACAGRTVADLLAHRLRPVRVAALDAYLMHIRPHTTGPAQQVVLPAGSSLAKSRSRAAAVVELLPCGTGDRVLVVGVVNSLLHELRSRGLRYAPCDLRSGRTEWGEPHLPDAAAAAHDCDALLVSGMTLGNGTFEVLARHARETGKPMVVFAQTGSAVAPWFLGAGVSAVSAEPYPFFWLAGDSSVIHRYRSENPASAKEST